jgi:hypothetical protein
MPKVFLIVWLEMQPASATMNLSVLFGTTLGLGKEYEMSNLTSNVGEEKKETRIIDPQKAALNKNMETAAWGFFLIMLGGFFFVPDSIVKGGVWSLGVGVILLGLNAARYFNGIRMSGFTTLLGILSIAGGLLELGGMKGVDGAVFLIVLGGYLILKPYFDKQGLFGKAEEK